MSGFSICPSEAYSFLWQNSSVQLEPILLKALLLSVTSTFITEVVHLDNSENFFYHDKNI